MDYDVVILGGGLAGCSVAARLAKYNLNIAVIERNFDIAEDVAPFISTFVTDGTDIVDDELYEDMAGACDKLQRLSQKSNFYFRKEPSLSVYENEEEFQAALKRVQRRNIPKVKVLSRKEALRYTQHIPQECAGILYHEETGIVSPYDMATALGEIAYENRVSFRMEEEVTAVKRLGHDEVEVTTNRGHYSCRVVVITAYNDLYLGSGEYRRANRDIPLHTMLLEKKFDTDIRCLLNIFHEEGEVTSLMPTFDGKTVAAIEDPDHLDYKQVKKRMESIIGPFPSERVDLLTENNFYDDPVQVEDHLSDKGYINMSVKNHYLPAFLPVLTERIAQLVVANFQASKNPYVVEKRRSYFRLKDMSNEERNEAIAYDPRFGKIICTCSMVTEGEIVNAIRRPLGARTVEGVKRRTGIVFGSCQGAYCMMSILKILAKELDVKPEEIINDRRNSRVLKARIKEFDEI